jgi:hypothetical protein
LLEPGLHHLTPSIWVRFPLEDIETNGAYVRSSNLRQ